MYMCILLKLSKLPPPLPSTSLQTREVRQNCSHPPPLPPSPPSHLLPPSLQTSGQLMGLSQRDGKLRVHYSDQLVALLQEVRQLAALGLPVPAKIQSTANTAQKFYQHGVILKLVCVCLYHKLSIIRPCCIVCPPHTL